MSNRTDPIMNQAQDLINKLDQLEPSLIKRALRLSMAIWYLLITITTFLSVNALLTNNIHPLYLVLSVTVPSLIFLILSLTNIGSLFAKIFLAIAHTLIKLFIKAPNPPPKIIANHSLNQAAIPFIKFISHSTWLLIFSVLITNFFIKFSLQHYNFYLGTTLFSEHSGFYALWINGLDAIPSLFNFTPLQIELINHTLAGSLTDFERGLWARWILIMLFFYGVIPRLIMTLFTLMTLVLSLRANRLAKQKSLITNTKIVDPALEKPTIIRPPKTITSGVDSYWIALDIPNDSLKTVEPVLYLNDIMRFSHFEEKLHNTPANHLNIMIDAAQTPDRGLLRRLIRLLNYSVSAHIYCIAKSDHSRFALWETHLTPLLFTNETLSEQKELLDH